ncbi:MAG: zinc metalloprotease HtpX [Geminicoccaceae bacterium]|nr:zinc metalloprotease HtpX [Geminicoccaceae bacterium]MCS7266642.1 zinc metalloprotease HtpX [Geminicoccaceae bacterium]MDW8123275.1 zinc metalloprotease HtpX [Geminicoccaceae bacterium]MDW8340424.1 zinc metalloprotease HtpX [Geminicoccaceae bacterium]
MIASVPVFVLSERQRRRHKLRNLAQSALLVAAMLLILGLCAYLLWGWSGVFWTLVWAGLSLLFMPSVAPEWVMRAYGAVPIRPAEFPEGYELLRRLSARAGLERVPRLYWLPSAILNAFAVGRRDRAAICLSDGLLQALSARELAGVIAHELSHIRNDDLWIMGLADLVSRLTSLLSWLGQLLLLINLPFVLAGQAVVPWLVVLLLVFAPTIVGLLQLALSRAREFDADLDAAGLTGDPRGLASALAKLERYQGRYWEEILFPGRRIPVPSLLRTHPPTEERIKRLLDLYERFEPVFVLPERIAVPPPRRRVHPTPRWHWPGSWY